MPLIVKRMALGELYRLVQQQTASLAYFDVFYLFSIAAFAVVPLVFLMRCAVSAKGSVSVH